MEKAENAISMTREQVASFLAEINRQIVEHNLPPIHTLLALNNILSQSNAHELLDEELKTQARDIWVKIKATGVHLIDPPSLFGINAPVESEDQTDGVDSSTELAS